MRQSETALLQVLPNTHPEAGAMLQCFVWFRQVNLKQLKKHFNELAVVNQNHRGCCQCCIFLAVG